MTYICPFYHFHGCSRVKAQFDLVVDCRVYPSPWPGGYEDEKNCNAQKTIAGGCRWVQVGLGGGRNLPSPPSQLFKTPWPVFAIELYRPRDRRLSAKLVPTFADKGCHMVSVTDPYCHILGFLDRNRYSFFPVAPQLHSWGWVNSVLDSLLFLSALRLSKKYKHCQLKFIKKFPLWKENVGREVQLYKK
jgi:hypothetical protein